MAKKKSAKKTPSKKKATKKKATKKAAKRRPAASTPKTTKKKAIEKKAAPKASAAPSPKKSTAKKPAAPALQSRPRPEVGQRAPGFDLPGDRGERVTLASLAGKKVVLYFYPKDDTPGCTVEACGLRDRYADIQAAGAVVLGVSRDSVEAHQKFKTKYALPFTLLSDKDGQAIQAYGAWGEKVFMGNHTMGILRSSFLIDRDGRIAKVYPKVSPQEHADEIVRDLATLG